ncbi:DUF445 domain-containing protein [Candidatus Bathyarchaeota archaeon]|nr:MAG: DUF445 domain-containing protein [Candidatus Bathyarchaeota archaeon]
MMLYYFLVLPLVSAVIGYVTNVIAVRLLFSPKKPIDFKIFRIQGLIPAKKRELSERIFTAVSDYFTSQDLKAILEETVRSGAVRKALQGYILERLKSSPLLSIPAHLNPRISEAVSKVIATAVESFLLGRFIPEIISTLAKEADVKNYALRTVEKIDVGEMEKLFRRIAGKELTFIEYSGAILGFIIGMIQAITLFTLSP